MRTPLKYPGGKQLISSWIVSLFPPRHHLLHYNEPFCGSAAVLFEKIPGSEVICDLDDRLSMFWKVLQTKQLYSEFVQRVLYTPFSEHEFKHAQAILKTRGGRTMVDIAWAYFIACRQSRSGIGDTFVPISRTRLRNGINEMVSGYWSSVEMLPETTERLRDVIVRNGDGIDCIEKEDSFNTIHYIDPPYPEGVRSASQLYEKDIDRKYHLRLLDTINQCKGKVLISSYMNVDYWHGLKGWALFKCDVPNCITTDGGQNTECIWRNY